MENSLVLPVLDFLATASDRAILAAVVLALLYELSRRQTEFQLTLARKDAQVAELVETNDRKTEALSALSDEVAGLREHLDELTDLLTS